MTTAPDNHERLLRNLLARIFRDGGQRTAEFVNLTEASEYADQLVAELFETLDANDKEIPTTAPLTVPERSQRWYMYRLLELPYVSLFALARKSVPGVDVTPLSRIQLARLLMVDGDMGEIKTFIDARTEKS